jgi:hypothetical protein
MDNKHKTVAHIPDNDSMRIGSALCMYCELQPAQVGAAAAAEIVPHLQQYVCRNLHGY